MKTVADCFKYTDRIGGEVGLAALAAAVRAINTTAGNCSLRRVCRGPSRIKPIPIRLSLHIGARALSQ